MKVLDQGAPRPDPPNTHRDDLQASSFRAVERWSRRMDGGMDNLDDLFVPINENNMHWLFLHVDFREKGEGHQARPLTGVKYPHA